MALRGEPSREQRWWAWLFHHLAFGGHGDYELSPVVRDIGCRCLRRTTIREGYLFRPILTSESLMALVKISWGEGNAGIE